MAEEPVVNPQVTDEIEEIEKNPENSGGDAGDAEDFHDPTPAAPVGGDPW